MNTFTAILIDQDGTKKIFKMPSILAEVHIPVLSKKIIESIDKEDFNFDLTNLPIRFKTYRKSSLYGGDENTFYYYEVTEEGEGRCLPE